MPLKIFYKKEARRSSSKYYAYGLCPIAKTKRKIQFVLVREDEKFLTTLLRISLIS